MQVNNTMMHHIYVMEGHSHSLHVVNGTFASQEDTVRKGHLLDVVAPVVHPAPQTFVPISSTIARLRDVDIY